MAQICSPFRSKLKEVEDQNKSFSFYFKSQVSNVKIQLQSIKQKLQENENLISRIQDCVSTMQSNADSKRVGQKRPMSTDTDIDDKSFQFGSLKGIKRLKVENTIKVEAIKEEYFSDNEEDETKMKEDA